MNNRGRSYKRAYNGEQEKQLSYKLRKDITMKKLTAILLTFIIMLSLVPFSSAASEITSVADRDGIIRDDDSYRVAVATVGEEQYIATYDKKADTVKLERVSNVTGEVEASVTRDMNTGYREATKNGVVTEIMPDECVAPRVSIGKQTTLTNYSYNYKGASSCSLGRPRFAEEPDGVIYSLLTVERASNKDYLANFKNEVGDIYAKEQTICTLVSAATFTKAVGDSMVLATSGAALGTAIGVYFTALGFGVSIKIACNELGALMNTAETTFDMVRDDYIYYL